MRCKTARKLLDPYLTQALAAAQRAELESHLRSCRSCREQVARLRQLAEVLAADARIPPVPADFRERVVSRAYDRLLERKTRVRPLRGIQDWWAAMPVPVRVGWAASLAAGLLTGVFLGNRTWAVSGQGPAGVLSVARPDRGDEAELNYLTDGPGDSLAQTFLVLTRTEAGRGS